MTEFSAIQTLFITDKYMLGFFPLIYLTQMFWASVLKLLKESKMCLPFFENVKMNNICFINSWLPSAIFSKDNVTYTDAF